MNKVAKQVDRIAQLAKEKINIQEQLTNQQKRRLYRNQQLHRYATNNDNIFSRDITITQAHLKNLQMSRSRHSAFEAQKIGGKSLEKIQDQRVGKIKKDKTSQTNTINLASSDSQKNIQLTLQNQCLRKKIDEINEQILILQRQLQAIHPLKEEIRKHQVQVAYWAENYSRLNEKHQKLLRSINESIIILNSITSCFEEESKQNREKTKEQNSDPGEQLTASLKALQESLAIYEKNKNIDIQLTIKKTLQEMKKMKEENLKNQIAYEKQLKKLNQQIKTLKQRLEDLQQQRPRPQIFERKIFQKEKVESQQQRPINTSISKISNVSKTEKSQCSNLLQNIKHAQ